MDDAVHLVMQCPKVQDRRNDMFKEIAQVSNHFGNNLVVAGKSIFLILLGRPCPNTPDEMMERIWIISAKHISNMYRWKLRQGIG